MHNNIIIASLNCRGLNTTKSLQIKHLMEKFRIRILLLQETHINKESEVKSIAKLFEGHRVICPLSSNKAKGVGFIISNDYEVLNFGFFENRLVYVELVLDNLKYTIVNLYAPNDYNDQVLFIEKLYTFDFKKAKNLIVAGDFNCDFSHKNLYKGKKNEREWANMAKNLGMSEIMNGLGYTWSNGTSMTSIDKFFLKCENNSCECEIKQNYKTSVSDHNLICMHLNIKKNEERACVRYKLVREWKLNESVLNDSRVNEYILNKCKFIKSLILKHNYEWYEYFIEDIIKMLKRESRRISEEKKREIKDLFDELNGLSDASENSERIASIKLKINNYYENKRVGMERRACAVKNNFVRQPSKVLIEQEIKNAKKNEIKKYECGDKTVTEDKEKIMSEMYEFYNNLLSVDRVEKESLKNYNFKIKKVDERERELFLERAITYDEAWGVITSMKDASPGPNGLTLAFFRKYFPYFGNFLIDIFNNTQISLSDTFNKINIKLIPKNAKVKKSINDLRPLSMTNYEYRIYTKILSNRLRNVSNFIIGDHQTCAIIGRRMNDNIVLTRDLIEDANRRKKPLNVVSVDQRKAFDSISHNYLFAILKHLELGDFIYNSLNRLYEKSYATVVCNQMRSEKIFIKSGIKQGCALSMMLYIIAIEELLVRVKANPNIKGYVVNVLERYELKASAYADDVTGYTVDDNSTKEFFMEFDEWGDISGASLNKEKTQYIRINCDDNSESEDVKILGVLFNKQGISESNFSAMKNKISQSMYLWSTVSLNMLERIVVCKTFILSKLWFLANFAAPSKQFLKDLNKQIHSFIWNSSKETIKRDTIILPYEEGGMNMFCVEAKLQTILVRQFFYLLHNFNRDFYCMSVFWMKFQLRDVLSNFNLIPSMNEKDIPAFYKHMSKSITEFKKEDKDFIKKIRHYTSKKVYEIFRKKHEKRPNCEALDQSIDWKAVYSTLNSKKLNSDLRVINYKLLHNGLSLDTKIEKLRKPCYFCDEEKESASHLMIECRQTKQWFDLVKHKLNYSIRKGLSKEISIYHKDLELEASKSISIFNLAIWRTRNAYKNQPSLDMHKTFLDIFYSSFYYYRKN